MDKLKKTIEIDLTKEDLTKFCEHCEYRKVILEILGRFPLKETPMPYIKPKIKIQPNLLPEKFKPFYDKLVDLYPDGGEFAWFNIITREGRRINNITRREIQQIVMQLSGLERKGILTKLRRVRTPAKGRAWVYKFEVKK